MPKKTSIEEVKKLAKLVDVTKPKKEEEQKPEQKPLTSGAIDKIVDLALNIPVAAQAEGLREVVANAPYQESADTSAE